MNLPSSLLENSFPLPDADRSLSTVAKEYGPFIDCTSNQVRSKDLSRRIGNTGADRAKADAYLELLNPKNAALLKKSAAMGRQLRSDYTDLTYEELAVNIAVSVLKPSSDVSIRYSSIL